MTEAEKLQALEEFVLAGGEPAVCEVMGVIWDTDDEESVRYYGISAYDQIIPFREVPFKPIEPRLINSGFHEFDLFADLTTDKINITFADADQELKNKFKQYGSGMRLDLYYYYPQFDYVKNVWWGQLLTPEIAKMGVVQVQASNGQTSGELRIGRRGMPDFCTAFFGANMKDKDDYRGNICKYNRQFMDGAIGNLDPLTGLPYTFCDHTEGNCIARLGDDGRGQGLYFAGFRSDVAPIISDANSGFSAISIGNRSRMTQNIPIIAGSKHVHAPINLFYRKEPNSSTPDHGWVSGQWVIGETCGNVDLVKINDKFIEALHLSIRYGFVPEYPTSYSPDIPRYSGTSVFSARYGWTNALTTELASLQVMARVLQGYPFVRVYDNPSSFGEIYTNNRTWWMMELYSNLRFGFCVAHSNFEIQDYIDAATKQAVQTRFTAPGGAVYDSPRTIFDAKIDPQRGTDVIVNIARAGRMTPPYQRNGKYTVSTLTRLYQSDLDDAPVFSDGTVPGSVRNIIWRGKPGREESTLQFKVTPPEKLVNEVTLTFEDGTKLDRARPITVKDEDAQLFAGKALGDSGFYPIPKNFDVAFGVRTVNEAVKLAYSYLWFGEFDLGGTRNNLGGQMDVPIELIYRFKRFDPIKIVSNDPTQGDFTHFRFQRARKNGDGTATVFFQAYNIEAYEQFEEPFDNSGTGNSEFSDLFPGSSIDTGKWDTASAAGFGVSGGTLNATNTSTSYLITHNDHAVNQRCISCEAVLVPTAASTTSYEFGCADSGAFDNYNAIVVVGTTLRCIFNGGIVNSFTYNATAHRWFRIRFETIINEPGDFTYQVVYQASTDGGSWDDLHYEFPPSPVVGGEYLIARLINTSGGSRSAKWDNVSIKVIPLIIGPPPPPPPPPCNPEVSSFTYENGTVTLEIVPCVPNTS